jgi:GntR family transcriptional regulator
MPQVQLPMYYRIEQGILEQIQSGLLKPGEQMPTEAELAERHNVSRITAKRALDDLVHQGLAFRQQGKGTFVASRRIRDISGFGSFSEDIRSRGLTPSSQVLLFKEVYPDHDIRERLSLGEGKRAFLLKRLRLADGEPVAVETAYIPSTLCPGLLEEDLAVQSLFAVLRDRFGISPTWADAEIESRTASKHEAGLLKMKAGKPVLEARRTTFTANYDVIECVDSLYRGDRFSFYTGRQRLG